MLSGANFIGSIRSSKGTETFQTFDPVGYVHLPEVFYEASDLEIDEACRKAYGAMRSLRALPKAKWSSFLLTVKEELESSKDLLLSRYTLETGLSLQRSSTEFRRTIQLISDYAALVESDCFPECSIDIPGDSGLPELRKTQMGIGPVVIFGASNFPLAYSTVGGDTVSAWAAGCPVIVKSHPMHAGTGELVSNCIAEAVRKLEMPEGIFSNLNGRSFRVGEKLVQHPLVMAVGFTGSLKGGRALANLAASRNEPIPVFAEMGSLNPVIILDDEESKLLNQAKLLAQSITTDAGQFCTKPGVIFVTKKSIQSFTENLEEEMIKASPYRMLHPDLLERYMQRIDEVGKTVGVTQTRHSKTEWPLEGQVVLSVADISIFLNHSSLHEEVFGPHVLIVGFDEIAELTEALNLLGGQLTTSVFGNDKSIQQSGLLTVISEMAGRIVFNGVPTGVMVNSSSNHGGPFPASSDSRFSAVGLESWRRFSRGIVFQNASQEMLPDALKDKNPLGLLRKVNGKLTKSS